MTQHRQNRENPNHGIARVTKKNKGRFLQNKRPFLQEGSTLPLVQSQNKESHPREYQRRASQLTFMALFGEGNGNPLQYSCLENSMDRGVWWATIHEIAKSRTRLSDFTFFFFLFFQRQRSRHMIVRGRRQRGCCNLGPGDCISCQAVRGLPVTTQVFLGYWTAQICCECHSLRPVPLRCTAHLEHCPRVTPRSLSGLDLGDARCLGL